MSVITAGTTTTTAYTITGDTNGNLVFKTGAGATTAFTLGSDQSATFVGAATFSGATTFSGTVSMNGKAYTWPSTYGTSGQFLQTNGAGALTWATVSQPTGIPTMNIVTGTTQTATAGNHYVLTNAAATTLTLPLTPAAGDLVWVSVGNGLSTNVVARNGQKIQSVAEDMTLNAQYAMVQMRYVNSTIGWTFT